MSSISDLHDLPFDEVFLALDGKQKAISAAAFFELPLSDRVRHVINRSVTFSASGVPIDQKAALAALRRYRAARATT
jgi:hypothetical protein